MNWRVKGVTQKILGAIPAGAQMNDLLQCQVGGLRDFRGHVASRVKDDWVVFADYMKELGVGLSGLRYVEIGTGWVPILPICYALAGAKKVITFDLTRHLNTRLTFWMLAMLDSLVPIIADGADRPLSEVKAHLGDLRESKSLDELLRRSGIEYHAPTDVSSSGLPDGSVDVVFSNNVMEHVPGKDIARMMAESCRILRDGGLVMHCVNCGDHYAYIDPTITQINYLTYSDRQWAFWNNRFLYQNRLRPIDFIQLAERSGLEIILVKLNPRPELLEMLPRMTIARQFRDYPPEQLCSTSIGFVARKRCVQEHGRD